MPTRKNKARETPAAATPAVTGEDLRMTTAARRFGPGTWVKGTVAGHRFEALVFPEHAEVADYEIGRSRISKLRLERLTDGCEVYAWDRGLDVPPVDATAAAVVEVLAATLAERVFGPAANNDER